MINRENLDPAAFGLGGLVLPFQEGADLYDGLGVEDKARVQGWLNGCPVVEDLIAERGAGAMLRRYSDINNAFLDSNMAIGHVNPSMAEQLQTSVARRDDEPVGKYEPGSVPENYQMIMAPMGTLVGYALPRLIEMEAKVATRFSNQLPGQGNLASWRKSGVNEVTREAIYAESSEELLATYAQHLFMHGHVGHHALLGQVLPKGWMIEHNSPTMLDAIKAALAAKAPVLLGKYNRMTEEDREQAKVA